jgi:hypothetical protein
MKNLTLFLYTVVLNLIFLITQANLSKAADDTPNIEELHNKLKFKKAVLIKSDDDPSNIIKTLPKQAIEWDSNTVELIESEDFKTYFDLSDSRTDHNLKKSGWVRSNLSGSPADIESKVNTKMSTKNQDGTIHLLSIHEVTKCILRVPLESIRIKEEFKNQIRCIETSNKFKAFRKLFDIFNDYGFSIPTEFHFGGRRFYESTDISSTKSTELEKHITFQTKVGQMGNVATGAESSSSTAISQAWIGITDSVIGGNLALKDEPHKWVKSLESSSRWQVHSYHKIKPIFYFLEEQLKTKCEGIISKICPGIPYDDPLMFSKMSEKKLPFDGIHTIRNLGTNSFLIRSTEPSDNGYYVGVMPAQLFSANLKWHITSTDRGCLIRDAGNGQLLTWRNVSSPSGHYVQTYNGGTAQKDDYLWHLIHVRGNVYQIKNKSYGSWIPGNTGAERHCGHLSCTEKSLDSDRNALYAQLLHGPHYLVTQQCYWQGGVWERYNLWEISEMPQ